MANTNEIIEGPTGPFGGLVPDTVKGRILAEIVADPFTLYTPSSLAELTDTHPRTVSKVLKEIEALGLVKTKEVRGRQPFFEVDASKKTLYALTFLALAVNDDQLGQDCMDQAVVEYTKKNLGCTMITDTQGVMVWGNGPGGERHIFTMSAETSAPSPGMGASG